MGHKSRLIASALITLGLYALWVWVYTIFGTTCEPGVPCTRNYGAQAIDSLPILIVLFAFVTGVLYLISYMVKRITR